MLDGILNICKPPGVGSTAVVGRVKRLLPRGTKVGHAGTLDAFASGVLLVLVGRATKRCEPLMSSPKQYVATLRLGATTPTHDPESPDVPTPGAIAPSRGALEAALAGQVGDPVMQLPPLYSALKVGGRRSSDRVRDGEPVQLQPRAVRIDRIELLAYNWPTAQIRVDCGRGTYIRSIARDVGETLGVGAYLTHLERTRVGEFWIESAVRIEELTPENLPGKLL
jgi:tRNA pseudouridine55 synthase